MLRRSLLAAFLTALTAASAAAQVPTTLPANSVLGRLGVTPGKPQAIPFATLFSGANVQPITSNLTALLAMGVGCAGHSGASAWTPRTITGTAGQITVTNGDCTLGNPTISLPAALSLSGIVLTGGAFSGGAFSGGTFTAGAFNGTLGATTPSTVAGTTGSFSGALSALRLIGGGTGATGSKLEAFSSGSATTDLAFYQAGIAEWHTGMSSGSPVWRLTSGGVPGVGIDVLTANLAGSVEIGSGVSPSDIFTLAAPSPANVVQRWFQGGVVEWWAGTISGSDKFQIGNSAGTSSPKITIDSVGNLGVGTTSPAAKLDVSGNLKTNGSVQFSGIPSVATPGCLANDATGVISGGNACSGGGMPTGGSLAQAPLNSASGTALWRTEPFVNISALTGADCTGVSATAISTVIGSIKSIALPTNCLLRMTGSDTIPTGVFFSIPCGARIQVDGAAILTFSGETDDNECQKFSASGAGGGSGTGTVRGLRLNRPEWWGAFGDCNYGGACTHDDSGPLQQAFNSVQNANSSSAGMRPQVKFGCGKGYGVSTGIVATASRFSPLLIEGCAPVDGGNSEGGSTLYGRSGFTGQVLTVTVAGSVSTNVEIRDFKISSINNFQADACLQIGSAGNLMGNASGHSIAHNLHLTNCKHLLKFGGSVVSFQFDRIWMLMGNNGSTSGANASCIEAVPNAEALSELTFNAIACDNSPNSDASAICLNFHSQGASGGITGTRIFDVSCYAPTTGLVLNADGASLIADFWCYSCQMDALRANSTGYYLATTGTATMADVVLDKTYATNVGVPFDVLNIDGSAGGTIKNIGVYGFYSAVGGAFRAIRVNTASQVNIQGARIGGTYTSQGILLNNCTGCLANNGTFSGTAPVFVLLGGSTDYSQACNNTASGALAPSSVSSSTAVGTHNNYYNAPGLQHCPNN